MKPVRLTLLILFTAVIGVGCGASSGGEADSATGPTANADPTAVNEVRRYIGFTEHALRPTQAAVAKCARLVQSSAEPDPTDLALCETDISAADGIFNAMVSLDADIRDVAPKAAPACRAALLRVETLDGKHYRLLDRIMNLPYVQRSRWGALAVANARLTARHRVALRRARAICAL